MMQRNLKLVNIYDLITRWDVIVGYRERRTQGGSMYGSPVQMMSTAKPSLEPFLQRFLFENLNAKLIKSLIFYLISN